MYSVLDVAARSVAVPVPRPWALRQPRFPRKGLVPAAASGTAPAATGASYLHLWALTHWPSLDDELRWFASVGAGPSAVVAAGSVSFGSGRRGICSILFDHRHQRVFHI